MSVKVIAHDGSVDIVRSSVMDLQFVSSIISLFIPNYSPFLAVARWS